MSTNKKPNTGVISRKSKKLAPVEMDLPEISDLDVNAGSSEEEVKVAEKPKRKPRAKKQPVIEPEPEVEEDDANSNEEVAEEAPKARGRPKKEKKPRAKSLWMTTLQENGFLVKGSSSKMPTKNSEEYKKIKAIYDAKKAALATPPASS